MYASRDEQLDLLETAYHDFVETLRDLAPPAFLGRMGDWAPRDIAAHFIGWNRITLVGCAELCEGVAPFYFHDGLNDYRKVNARFFESFSSTDREVLLKQMKSSMTALVAYLKAIAEAEWELKTGIVHYRGGPATVARCVNSLIRDYRKHREEIISGLQRAE